MAEVGYARAIFKSGWQVWGLAALEIFVVAGVSLIPLLGAALRQVLPPDSKIYLSDAFTKAFLSGQLLFYALGLIATVVWQSNKDWKSFFPLRAIFNIYSIGCVAICSIVIGFDPELSGINKAVLGPFSVGIFATSLIAYAFMGVIAQVQVNVGKALAKSDAALGQALRRSRGIEE